MKIFDISASVNNLITIFKRYNRITNKLLEDKQHLASESSHCRGYLPHLVFLRYPGAPAGGPPPKPKKIIVENSVIFQSYWNTKIQEDRIENG